MMRHWYVAQTKPNGEHLAGRHLVEQDFQVFLPRYRRVVRHARRQEIRLAPLFPGYIFVGMDADAQRWRSVNGTIGVRHLLCADDRPLMVPDTVMAELRRRADASGLVKLEEPPAFRPGDRLEVVEGVLASRTGLFQVMADQDRVVMLLDLLGRRVPVTVAAQYVRACP